jgi:hypothetical protein
MTQAQTSAYRSFLEKFFGEENQLNLHDIESPKHPARVLVPWIKRLELGLPTVLPYKNHQDTTWYGIAQSERQLRGLEEYLTAFIGPTWSTFRGQQASLDPNNPVEAAITNFTEGRAFKFQGQLNNKGQSTEIWQALELMRQVIDHKVAPTSSTPRATGRVLRDFFMALQVGDRPAAESQLLYLQKHNRLDPSNLLFLKVRMLSELQEWQELLNLSELPDLLQTRRPNDVTQALIRAVYQKELKYFEQTNAVQSAVTYFHESVLPQYSSLYTARGNSHQPETLKSFMILAVGSRTPNANLCQELLLIPGLSKEDQAYLEQLSNLLSSNSTSPQTPTLNSLQQAEEAAQQLSWDEVLKFASPTPPSLGKTRLLFQVFYEVETLETHRAALQAYQELSPEDQAILESTRLGRDCLKQLCNLEKPTNQIPDNWLSWLQELDKNPEWDIAVDIARQGEQEWNITQLLTENGAIQQFTNLLNSVGGNINTEQSLANALPHLLGAFQNDEQYPRREFAPIYRYLIDLLVMTSEGGDPDLVLFNELVIALLQLGTNQHIYQEIIGYALDLWENYGSPAKIDWILDLINILVIQPCLDQDLRSQILFAAATTLQKFSDRIDDIQWNLFDALVRDLNIKTSLPDLPPQKEYPEDSSETNIFTKLAYKSVLIYTLTEPVAQRVKTLLENSCEGIKIHVSYAKGGSEQLKNWVRNDDLVVMVTASAKHAATNFIEAHITDHKNLIRVNSKGSAGMLREIQSHLNQTTS